MMSALTLAVVLLSAVSLGLLGWALRLRRKALEARVFRDEPAVQESREMAALRDLLASLHERCRLAQDRAAETEHELAALVYAISHDLRAPLRGIDGFSQAVIEDHGRHLDATAQAYLARVRANATQINAMIDDLLALSKVVRAPFRPETVDVSTLARSIAVELSASEPTRPVRWEIPANIVATADRALLTEALRQLLANAWKFTSARDVAQISVCTLPPDPEYPGGTVYQVGDNGVGFDLQYAGRLFGPFQKMHSPEEFPSGRGIGLALVQRIVRRHEGRVWVDSAPGQGARFSFTLAGDPTVAELAGVPSAERTTPLSAAHGAAGAPLSKATTV